MLQCKDPPPDKFELTDAAGELTLAKGFDPEPMPNPSVILDVDTIDKFTARFDEIWREAFDGRGEAVQRHSQLGVVFSLSEHNP